MADVFTVQDRPTRPGALSRYIASTPPELLDPAVAAFHATLDAVGTAMPDVARSIADELRDQRSNLKLIASENFSSLAVQLAQGTLLTDKYAEGVPGCRFYATATTSTLSSGGPRSWRGRSSGPITPTSSRTRERTPT